MSRIFDWNTEKNEWLKRERGVCFEDVVGAFDSGKVLDRYPYPNQKKYPNQKIAVVEIDNYAYLVPYVEDELKIFLKTIIPNREATKKYLVKP